MCRPSVTRRDSADVADSRVKYSIDPSVLRALPKGSRFVSATTYSTAAWTRAFRVDVILEHGEEKSYFLKCSPGETGNRMLTGEYASLLEIAKVNPFFTPHAFACGQFEASEEPLTFILMEFMEIETGAPEPATFGRHLARFHIDSCSPTGKFGFHMTTYHGPNWQDTRWEDSWTVFFARLLRQFYERDIASNGPSADGIYETEFEKLITIALPQLLDALQSNGNRIRPMLVHCNLWEENCATENATGQPKVFDAGCLYGHNELELGMWRRDCVRFGRLHIKHYLRHCPPDSPREQWDDRNRLYSIKYDLAHCIAIPPSCEGQRAIILENAMFLNNKYSTGSYRGAPPSSTAATSSLVKTPTYDLCAGGLKVAYPFVPGLQHWRLSIARCLRIIASVCGAAASNPVILP